MAYQFSINYVPVFDTEIKESNLWSFINNMIKMKMRYKNNDKMMNNKNINEQKCPFTVVLHSSGTSK